MSPSEWGPKVWYLLHRVAFFSNRTDIPGAWKNVIQQLSMTMPCSLCRTHMQTYCKQVPLGFPSGASGAVIRDTIVNWLFHFHNSVNSRKGVDSFDYEFLRPFYGLGIHADAVIDGRRVLKEIEEMWIDVPHILFGNSVRHLLGLIGGGELG
uniref:thiol oxidase n=1 Tax=viral metagenome TaxID=1070528 RepID=A0A6C0KX96_9ZZZZ